MNKLSNEKWFNIFRNVTTCNEESEYSNEIEILQLDSTNEFVLCHGCEVFEDGFTSEEEARHRLEEVEQIVHDKKFLMKKLKEGGVWYPQDSGELEDLINDLENNPDFTFFTETSDLEEVIEECEYQGIELNSLVTMATNRYGNVIEIIYNKECNNYHVFVGAY